MLHDLGGPRTRQLLIGAKLAETPSSSDDDDDDDDSGSYARAAGPTTRQLLFGGAFGGLQEESSEGDDDAAECPHCHVCPHCLASSRIVHRAPASTAHPGKRAPY